MSEPIVLRDLVDVAGCRDVVRLQEAVWGRDSEVVPASLLVASVKRGGLLIGAFDDSRLAGFVWSMPAVSEGQLTHWSHMLGVAPDARSRGLGQALKRAQRDRAMAAGIDLIEWTFDPLQAPNAHLNIARLGCVATTYLVDAYGDMPGPLHRGTPTDRLIACWTLGAPHVERRLARADRRGRGGPIVRSAEVLEAGVALEAGDRGALWAPPGTFRLDLAGRRVLVSIPPRFTEMQASAPDVALVWRMAAREVFLSYFARGYRVVDFLRAAPGAGGQYLLEAPSGA